MRGIGMNFLTVPLHRIYVKTQLVSGFFLGAVGSSFPMEGVDFILGNDLAGGKVYRFPEVVERPITNDEMAQEHPDLYNVGVLTRAQARIQAQTEFSDSVTCIDIGS